MHGKAQCTFLFTLLYCGTGEVKIHCYSRFEFCTCRLLQAQFECSHSEILAHTLQQKNVNLVICMLATILVAN